MNSHELKELVKLIINNKVIIFNNNRISKDTLRILNGIINGSVSNESELTKEQKELIVKAFITLKKSFNKHTPNFILENIECIKSAVSCNLNSINYLDETRLDNELKNALINMILQHDFALTKNSPLFLCKNLEIIKKSIALDINSADYVDWLELKDNEIDYLINMLLNNNYVLHSKSHIYLKNNADIVLSSIKNNINNIAYAGDTMKEESEIFKYLLLNGYEFSKNDILGQPLNTYTDPNILHAALTRLGMYISNNSTYRERLLKIYHDSINFKPQIKDFDEILRYYSEATWENEKSNNSEMYNNIFGKICAELRRGETFQVSLNNLRFLEEMEIALSDKYYDLLLAMQEFYLISHSTADNKIEKLENSKNIIAKLSALYISKSKDNYINECVEISRDYLYQYFHLNLDNPYVYKKLVLSKQKELFIQAYKDNNPDICQFIKKLIADYQDASDRDLVKLLIDDFLIHDNSHAKHLLNKPTDYSSYIRYEEAKKLIHRLNNGYIKYQDREVVGYHDIISYDYQSRKYFYTGKQYEEEIYKEYECRLRLYNNLKKAIMLKVKEIELTEEIDKSLVRKLADELPFTDDYFVYNQEQTLKIIYLHELVDTINDYNKTIDPNRLISDVNYHFIYNLLINQGIIWSFLTLDCGIRQDFNELGINTSCVLEIINNLPQLFKIANDFNFDLNKIKELWSVYKISSITEEIDLAILGKDIINKLYDDIEFTSEDVGTIIRMSKDLICQMTARSKSTVPYVSGNYLNYRYSLYDSQDNSILTAGIDTDACFRIDGIDNDFLHYCALDKNGFVIKITDEFGNFIARASGFRNGNCVFINQLRTIHDQSGNDYQNDYDYETEDIINTFKIACQDILKTSQNNTQEQTKIDYIFVTQSYCLSNYPSNVSGRITAEIGDDPMEIESEDWCTFVNNTSNLKNASTIHDTFSTDYGLYSLICIASIKEPVEIQPDDIKKGDVPALYNRSRSKITFSTEYNEEVFKKINKIEAIICYFNQKEYHLVEFPENSLAITGDNWYIIYSNGKFVQGGLLARDEHAKIELQATIEVMEKIYQDKLLVSSSLIEMMVDAKVKQLLK